MRLDRNLYPEAFVKALPCGPGKVRAAGEDWLLPDDLDDSANDALNRWLTERADQLFEVTPAQEESPESAALLSLPVLNHYRATEIVPGIHFLSVDTGRWMLMDDTTWEQLRGGHRPMADALERNFVLLTEQNVSEYIQQLAKHYSFLTWGPTLHILVVTRQCNLRCVYCQAGCGPGSDELMAPETARLAVDRAFETPAGALTLEFQGGEPLLAFPSVQAAAERAMEWTGRTGKPVRLSLVSNFTEPATEDKLRYLAHRGFGLCVSLDGPAEVHDRNRGVGRRTCFAQVEANIRTLQRLWPEEKDGALDLNALLTTTRATLSHAKEIVETYLGLGLRTIGIRAVAPIGRGRLLPAELSYSVREFLDFWEEVVAYVLDCRDAGHDLREETLELVLRKLFGRDAAFMDLRSPCGAAFGQIVYDTDGSVYTCDEARMVGGTRFRLGHVESPLPSLLREPAALRTAVASVAEQYWCDHCAFKPFCGVCPVLHHADTGFLVTDIRQQRRCAIQEGMIRHVLGLYATNRRARQHFHAMVLESFDDDRQ